MSDIYKELKKAYDFRKNRCAIFTPCDFELFRYVLRCIDPRFVIYTKLILSVPDKYYFNGAYCVFDHRENEDIFVQVMDELTELYGLGSYYYRSDENTFAKRTPKTGSAVPVEELIIDDSNADAVLHIMYMALGSYITKHIELEPLFHKYTTNNRIMRKTDRAIGS